MATYNQYSEVVAAYGYTTPPPPQPQTNRVGLALLYAFVGVALGTMTGTTMAAVSMQNTAGLTWPHHLALFRLAPTPVPATHKAVVASNQNKAAATITPAAPAPIQGLTAAPIQASVANPTPAAPVLASIAVPVPVAPVQAVAPKPSMLSRVMPTSVVEASVDINSTGLPVRSEHAPVRIAPAPAVHKARIETASLTLESRNVAPPARPAVLSMPEAIAPPTVEDVTLDEHVRTAMTATAMYFSEGDASVVDYDATAGTIATSDGKTFVVGPTVSMANAPTWDDYRDNVHYRCDQSGKCSLMRTGVVALNARMI
jgi:hypothetical protein